MTTPTRIELEGSVDPHFHFRNTRGDGDGRMEMLLAHVAGEHEVAVAIGNTKTPITTLAQASEYRRQILGRVPEGRTLDIRVAPLLTDQTTPEMIREMRRDPHRRVAFVKAFFSGVSNDGGASVSHIDLVKEAIRATYDDSVDAPVLPIDLHAERKFDRSGNRLEMREREWYCVDTDIRELMVRHPEANFALKHVSDYRTLEFILEQRDNGKTLFGEICPSYLVDSFEDLWEGPGGGTALQANKVRWPIPKSDKSKEQLRAVVFSGDEGFFYGSDCACHVENPRKAGGVKITCDGYVCGGATILPAVDKSIVIELLTTCGREWVIDEFMSRRARRRLGLPPSSVRTVYERTDWQVPTHIERGPIKARLYMEGQICHWRRVA